MQNVALVYAFVLMAFMTKKKHLYPLLSILLLVSTIAGGVRVNVLSGQSPMWAIMAKQRAQRVAVVHVGSIADEHKKARIIKILVPLLIVAIIAVLWLIKTGTDKSESTLPPINNAELPEHLKNADFSLEVNAPVDFESLAEYGLPAIIDYGSDSCIPCKEMAPALKLLNEEMYGKAFVKFADVWVYSDAASNVPIQVIPTQVLVNADGTPFVPSDELAAKIQFTMYSDKNTNEHVFTVHQGGLTEEEMREILIEMGVE